jgi:hypothetical protein
MNNRSARAIAKINLQNIKAAYITVIVCVVALVTPDLILRVYISSEEIGQNVSLSTGWVLWLLPVLAAILISARNFTRIAHLGGKREAFFRGCLLTYVVLAGAASLLGVAVHYAGDIPYVAGNLGGLITVPDVFGWGTHGPVVFFLQQFAFLFLSAVFAHTLTAVQGRWYGWALNGALIAMICVFPPIAPLRAALADYFHLILINPNALLQIAACLAIGIALYLLNRPILARKAI